MQAHPSNHFSFIEAHETTNEPLVFIHPLHEKTIKHKMTSMWRLQLLILGRVLFQSVVRCHSAKSSKNQALFSLIDTLALISVPQTISTPYLTHTSRRKTNVFILELIAAQFTSNMHDDDFPSSLQNKRGRNGTQERLMSEKVFKKIQYLIGCICKRN